MSSNINYTIIIPHRNSAKLLGRLLSTIPLRDDMQVIVVDDCSDADEYNLVKEIVGKYPGYELYQTDSCGGGGKARNVGLRHAKGKYLIFADADDYFNACFSDVLDKYTNSKYDIVYFIANVFEEGTYICQNDLLGYFTDPIKRFLQTDDALEIKYNFTSPWAKLFNREMIVSHNICFQESMISNDIRFAIQADYYASRLKAEMKAIYFYGFSDTSTSRKPDIIRRLKRMEIDSTQVVFLKEKENIKPYPRFCLLHDYKTIVQFGCKEEITTALEILDKCGISKKEINKIAFRVPLKRRILNILWKIYNRI